MKKVPQKVTWRTKQEQFNKHRNKTGKNRREIIYFTDKNIISRIKKWVEWDRKNLSL